MSSVSPRPSLHPELHDALNEFNEWWNERGAELYDINKVTGQLFHFTNMAGLAAIINSQ